MTTLLAPTLCTSCVHLRPNNRDGSFTCDAFPIAIPRRYISGEVDHTTPDPEDNGIQYEMRPDLAEMIERA